MQLTYRPDFDEVRATWNRFWNDEPLKRPLVWGEVPKDSSAPRVENPGGLAYFRGVTGRWDEQLACIDRWLEATRWLGEALPYARPDYGPDQFAACLGAPLRWSEDSKHTTWVDPVVQDWDSFSLRLDPEQPTWKSLRAWCRRMAEHLRGRALVMTLDLHSNMDALSALRGAQNLCLDMLDCPEVIDRAMRDVRALFPVIYDGLYEASLLNRETGSFGWLPFWCEGRFVSLQCDFCYLIGPKEFRRYVLPALEEEAAYVDCSGYHLDGIGSLVHLDDILTIKDIGVMQWVSGAGQKHMWEWTDVLRKCLKAGKALHLYDMDCEQAKLVHRELKSRRCLYAVRAKDAREIEDLIRWFERH